MSRLQGKVALVTGAGQGVGQGIAFALAVEGAQVAVAGRTLQKLESTCHSIEARGGQAFPIQLKLCYPHLKGGGCIINLATTAAKRWDASHYGAYAAAKEAIRALTRAAASEWGKDNIRTNVVLPLALSPGLKGWMESNGAEGAKFAASVPMKRVGDCEQDIGRFVAMLCSDDAAYVNGQSIALDGGQVYLG